MTKDALLLLESLLRGSLRTEMCSKLLARELCSHGLATVTWECQDGGSVLSPTMKARVCLAY